MVHLGVSAPQEDAKRASGFSVMEWQRFLIITKQEARTCAEAHPSIQWTYYTANEKWRVVGRINAALERDGVRPLTPDIIHWRMAKVVRDTLRARKSVRTAVACEDDTRCKKDKGKHMPINTANEDTVESASTPRPQSRAFDPIRDI